MLAGSGHIAGVVNPPAASKYGYWTNDELPADPEEWLAGRDRSIAGSWWTGLAALDDARCAGEQVPARVPGDGKLPAIEDAPGSYVKAKAA